MYLELQKKPIGCNAVTIENDQEVSVKNNREGTPDTITRRVIGRAVCGGRQSEATADYSVAPFSSANGDHHNARQEVVRDMTDLVSAMCIDCPNRKENPID